MSDPLQTTMDLNENPGWFELTGDGNADHARLLSLIFATHEDGDQLDAQAQLTHATIVGFIKAFGMGLQAYPSVYAFVDACVQLSAPDTDPPGTLADLYCQHKAQEMAEGLAKLPMVDERTFRSELRRLKIRRTCKLTDLNTVRIFKNAAVWTDKIGADLVIGFIATSTTGDHYTILIRNADLNATGAQLMRMLRSVCDGNAAPLLSDLVGVSYFAVGGGASGNSIALSCDVLVQLTAPRMNVLGTVLTDSADDAGLHKAIAVFANGQVCCTKYPVNGFATFLGSLPSLPLSDPMFFDSAAADKTLQSVACTTGTVQFFQGNGLVVTGIKDCFVVGVRGAYQKAICGAIVCGGSDTGTDCGEDLLDALLGVFDGVRAPLLTDLVSVQFIVVGGRYGHRAKRFKQELLCELYERGLDTLGVRTTLHQSDADLTKALMIKANGFAVCTVYAPPQDRKPVDGIIPLSIDLLRASARACGYYEVGANFDTTEYDKALCMPDDGIWTDHMGPCVTVGLTGVNTVTGERSNALMHSFNPTTRGKKILETLSSIPGFGQLKNVGYFVIGGSPNDVNSVEKVASVLREIEESGLRLIGSWPTTGLDCANLAKAVMITKDGKIFASKYAPKT